MKHWPKFKWVTKVLHNRSFSISDPGCHDTILYSILPHCLTCATWTRKTLSLEIPSSNQGPIFQFYFLSSKNRNHKHQMPDQTQRPKPPPSPRNSRAPTEIFTGSQSNRWSGRWSRKTPIAPTLTASTKTRLKTQYLNPFKWKTHFKKVK